VRETKGSSNIDDLFREAEAWKVTFGKKHYDALGVDYKVVRKASELDTDDSPSLVETELESRIANKGNEQENVI
jgi:restriction endonuclease